MAKTLDERLFEQMMRIPRTMRKRIMDEGVDGGDHPGHPHHMRGPEFGHERGHCPGHRHGHRPFTREHILTLIQDSEAGLRQKEVGEALKIGPSATSELIDKLEHDGYVKRTVDPDDKRATKLVLTEMGEARANEVRDQHQKRIGSMFSALTDEEKEELLRLLEKLTSAPEA